MKNSVWAMLLIICVGCGGNSSTAPSGPGPTANLNGVWNFAFTSNPTGIQVETVDGTVTLAATSVNAPVSFSGTMSLAGQGGAVACSSTATVTGATEASLNTGGSDITIGITVNVDQGGGCPTLGGGGTLNLSTCSISGNNWSAVQASPTCTTP